MAELKEADSVRVFPRAESMLYTVPYARDKLPPEKLTNRSGSRLNLNSRSYLGLEPDKIGPDKLKIKDEIMPAPTFNVIHGGSHAGNKLVMQEFMVLPSGNPTFSEAMGMGSELYHHLKKTINSKYGMDATAVGDEGGFALNSQDNKETLDLLMEAIKMAGYEGKIEIGMNIAPSEFCKNGKHDLDFKNPETKEGDWITSDQLGEMYKDFIKNYPMVSLEDTFDRDDWEGWSKLTGETDIQIVGDDLTVINPKRIQMAVDKKCASSSKSADS